MRNIEHEKRIVKWMILFYCRKKHQATTHLCNDCEALELYSIDRLSNCPFREHKKPCKNCKVHCYRSDRRVEIRKVMKYSGSRIIVYYPLEFLKHLF